MHSHLYCALQSKEILLKCNGKIGKALWAPTLGQLITSCDLFSRTVFPFSVLSSLFLRNSLIIKNWISKKIIEWNFINLPSSLSSTQWNIYVPYFASIVFQRNVFYISPCSNLFCAHNINTKRHETGRKIFYIQIIWTWKCTRKTLKFWQQTIVKRYLYYFS